MASLLTQIPVEVLAARDGAARLTTAYVEVLTEVPPPPCRLTQAYLEVTEQWPTASRLSQAYLEVLVEAEAETPPPIPPEIAPPAAAAYLSGGGQVAGKLHRFAVCWAIARTDGLTLRFTDHDAALYVEGRLYVPAGGFTASARQRQDNLGTPNLALVGILSDDSITDEDLRGGKYREAQITELIVDWRYPWAGVILRNVYWLSEVAWANGRWEAQVVGLAKWLQQPAGRVYARQCRHTLGDAHCKVDLAAYAKAGVITRILDPQRRFETSLTAAAGYYDDGELTWVGGANDGLASETRVFTQPNGTLSLWLPAPYTVAVGDAFRVIPGCDKSIARCRNPFNNVINFGGFPSIPGNDKMFRTPT